MVEETSHLDESGSHKSSAEPRFLKYTFYKVDKGWRHLSQKDQQNSKEELIELFRRFSSRISIKGYSLVGIRGDADFLIWATASNLEDIHLMGVGLNATRLARYLNIPYSYLAMSKPTQYRKGNRDVETSSLTPPQDARGYKYVFVYPFIKKRSWYRLPHEERRRMMGEHFRIGHKYPTVKIHTGYSFGLDDQEFMLAFEADNPADFLGLVEELRGTEVSSYTELETPIFSCIAMNPEQMLDTIG